MIDSAMTNQNELEQAKAEYFRSGGKVLSLEPQTPPQSPCMHVSLQNECVYENSIEFLDLEDF